MNASATRFGTCSGISLPLGCAVFPLFPERGSGVTRRTGGKALNLRGFENCGRGGTGRRTRLKNTCDTTRQALICRRFQRSAFSASGLCRDMVASRWGHYPHGSLRKPPAPGQHLTRSLTVFSRKARAFPAGDAVVLQP
jgi:hypothetical protein